MYSTYEILEDLYGLSTLADRVFSEYPVSTGRAEFPRVNLAEHDDIVEITAMMPGVSPGSLNLQLVDKSIVIEGEKKADYEDQPYLRKERMFGSFKKSVTLPYGVDHERIEASVSEGILRIRLHKSEDAKPKKIEIH
ncbi:MAG: Hsp20/alpha crystallin family protein [Spirochaetes bacterium]|nr:MAG: Hsp20/alpha crystallin family protein [Spirochaetota bacterium]